MTMERVTIERLSSDVAAILGESLALECQPEESPFPGIEDRVRIRAPGIIRDLLTEASWEDLSDCEILTGPVSIDIDGVVTLRLPPDFLRLKVVKMSDWKRAVKELIPSDSETARCQGSRWEGVRGSADRPVAILDYDSGGNCLKLYSSAQDATLDYGFYVKTPEFSSEGVLEIPGKMFGRLLEALRTSLLR